MEVTRSLEFPRPPKAWNSGIPGIKSGINEVNLTSTFDVKLTKPEACLLLDLQFHGIWGQSAMTSTDVLLSPLVVAHGERGLHQHAQETITICNQVFVGVFQLPSGYYLHYACVPATKEELGRHFLFSRRVQPHDWLPLHALVLLLPRFFSQNCINFSNHPQLHFRYV